MILIFTKKRSTYIIVRMITHLPTEVLSEISKFLPTIQVCASLARTSRSCYIGVRRVFPETPKQILLFFKALGKHPRICNQTAPNTAYNLLAAERNGLPSSLQFISQNIGRFALEQILQTLTELLSCLDNEELGDLKRFFRDNSNRPKRLYTILPTLHKHALCIVMNPISPANPVPGNLLTLIETLCKEKNWFLLNATAGRISVCVKEEHQLPAFKTIISYLLQAKAWEQALSITRFLPEADAESTKATIIAARNKQ